MTMFREESSMTDWSPNRWTVQQNIARLKRWIEIDPDESRRRKLKGLLEAEELKLGTLDNTMHRMPSDDPDEGAFWGS